MKWKSAIITELSGSVGNLVASTSRGGVGYFRKKVIPANPNTLLQQAVRAAIASASVFWNTILSEADQEAWWDLAEGSQTGQTLFVKVNQPRIYAQNAGRTTDESGAYTARTLSIIDTPPESFSTPLTSPTAVVIDDSANTLKFNVNQDDPWVTQTLAIGESNGLYVYASHQQQPSRFSQQHSFQMLAAVVRENGDLADPDEVTINLATYGFTTIVGRVMYLKFIAQDKFGSISVPIIMRVTITA